LPSTIEEKAENRKVNINIGKTYSFDKIKQAG
jgi:hypothetical protein